MVGVETGLDRVRYRGRTVKVPYAKKWQKEADKLRKIVLDCDLIENTAKTASALPNWSLKPSLPVRSSSNYVC